MHRRQRRAGVGLEGVFPQCFGYINLTHHKGLADKIEKCQRRFTNRIYCLSNLFYEDRL